MLFCFVFAGDIQPLILYLCATLAKAGKDRRIYCKNQPKTAVTKPGAVSNSLTANG